MCVCIVLGVDAAVLNGGLPELLIIGVPPALNGSACRDPAADQCSQRFFELTPTPCDSSVSACDERQPSGGADQLLRFVWEEVVPAVFAQLGVQRGAEVGIMGYSLGGLTACYAASALPDQFQRALCLSPSVWWNSGQLARIIASNFEDSGAQPVSVVMSVGTQEGPSIMAMNSDQQPWTVYLQDTVAAWQRIGLGKEASSTSTSTSTSTSNLFYYSTAGGIHNIISWVDSVSFGLTLLYRPEFPAPYPQSSARVTWQYPPGGAAGPADCPSNNDSDDVITWISAGNKTLLLVVTSAFCLLLLPANMYYLSKANFLQTEKKQELCSGKEAYRLIEDNKHNDK